MTHLLHAFNAMLGWLKGLQSAEPVEAPLGESPIGPRPGVSHPNGHQPDRPSGKPAKPPQIVTVVQSPDGGVGPERGGGDE